MSWVVWMGLALGALVALALLGRPLRRMGRLLARWGGGVAVRWGLQGVGPSLGICLGVNPLNALVVGVLGAPGFGLLLLTQWVFR